MCERTQPRPAQYPSMGWGLGGPRTRELRLRGPETEERPPLAPLFPRSGHTPRVRVGVGCVYACDLSLA